MPDAVPQVLRRLADLRSWASTPARRRIAYAVALALFVGSTVVAWQALPARGELDWGLVALAALLVLPGAVINAEEYRVSGRIVGQRIALPAALRVSIIAAAFNLLPIPGSVLVRTRALAKGGSSTARAVTSTLAVGLAYLAVALVIVAGVQLASAPVQAAVLAVIGLAMLAGTGVLVRRLADGPAGGLLRRLVLVEALSVVVKALRLLLTIQALGFEPSIAQATSLSMATVAASAIGIFPGGLGIRELLSGLIAPAVDLPASVGLVGTSMDRLIGLATLSVLAAIVLFATRERLPRPDGASHPSVVADIDAVFKAYDIRGITPDQLDAELVRSIGAAFARFVRTQPEPHDRVLVGRDMRPSGVELVAAFCEGVTSQGMDVTRIGLASTDMLYFAAGSLDAPGAMFTASHNPAQYNGIKMTLAGAKPIGSDTGMDEIKRMILEDDLSPQGEPGTIDDVELLDAFADHVRSFIDTDALVPVKVVADTANGMGGLVVPAVFEGLPVDLEVMYGELDGTFPNHPADPIDVENLRDLQARVLEVGADVGLAFDGDADRVFLVDDLGQPVSGSITTAIVAKGILEKEPGATILHNLICSKTVPEVVIENGGTPIRTRVGHSFIKATMAETGAAFGGEHSAHYYFRENWRADSGCIASLVVLEQLSRTGQKLSELRKPFERYAASGEINTTVDDPAAVIDRVAAAYADHDQDRLDGLTVDLGDWWFNLRPSNTEPLLRLNLEAATREQCDAKVEEVRSHFVG
ncbi:MAG TPA: phosphomannomutase/phosphoglucomutase [Acidimicrobiales bacterium]|nr:phosphomannomutase/phosphoglucomutase [Acidimicrobiales bacterium]